MISSKLLISGVGLVGAVAGFAAFNTSFFSDTNISENVEKNEKVLITKVTSTSGKDNILETGLLKGEKINYVCKIGEKIIKDCKIYKLNTSNQRVLLSNKNDVVDNAIFAVVYSNKEDHKISHETVISIFSKDSETKKYFDLTIASNIFHVDNGTKAKTIIAKITEIEKIAENNTHKTPYKINKNQNCKIYKLPEETNLKATDLPFAASSINLKNQITKKSGLSVGQYVVIDKSENNMFDKNWKESTKEIYLNDGTTKFFTFEYVAPIVGEFDSMQGVNQIKEDENAYLVVSSSNALSNAGNDFYASARNGYKCKVPLSADVFEFDTSCQLYKLNSTDPDSNQTTVDLHKIVANESELKVTTAPAANKKFILKISRNLLERIHNVQNSKISLVSTSTNTKNYIDLEKVHLLENHIDAFKTNIILAKVKNAFTTGVTSETVDFDCKINSGSEKVPCKVLMITDTLSNPVNASQLKKITNTSPNIPAVNHHVLIELVGNQNKKTEKELRSYAPEIYKKGNSDNDSIKTEYVDSYVGLFNATTTASSSLFKVVESPQDYLVVVSETVENNTLPTEDLIVSSTKKYRCKLNSPELTDETCTLISITEPSNRGINFSDVSSATTKANDKNSLSTKKYFKLVVNKPELIKHNFTDSSTITIENKTTPNTKYGVVKVVSKFLYSQPEGKTKWFLAKSTSDISSDATITSFECKFTAEVSFTSCEVYKESGSFSSPSNSEIDLSGFTKPSSKTKADLANEKHVIVKLTSEKSINELTEKTIEIAINSNTTKSTTLSVVKPVYVIEGANGAISGKPLILS